MKQKISYVLFGYTILCSLCFLCKADVGNLTLELVQVVFRHGARTPSLLEAFLVNSTNPPIYRPEGYYQLTNEGKQQAYALGVFLRKKYNNFLGVYNAQEYNALSTSISRTIMSLQLVLAGLFPPSLENLWNKKLKWNPIFFHHNSVEIKKMLMPHQSKKYMDLYSKTIAESSEYQRELSKYTEFIEFMTNKTGVSFKENVLYNIGCMYYGINYHRVMNLPLPNWYTDDSIFVTLAEVFKLELDGMSLTPQLRRLNGGTLVRQFIKNINENRKATVPKKIYLYSSHDLTIYGFSKAQDLQALYIPPFGCALIMEKYRDFQNSEYLRILSWDPADGENFKTVKIANCKDICPFEDYLEIVKNNVATDKDLEYLQNVTSDVNFI